MFSQKEKALQKKYKKIGYLLLAITLTLCVLAPVFIGKYYTGFITLAFIYAIITIGFNISSGFCGVTTFSTGALYAVGAYVSGILISSYHFPFIIAALIGTLLSGALGLVISLSAYKVSGTYLTLVSYGLLEVVNRIIIQWYDVTGGSSGLHIAKWTLFGREISRIGKYYIVLGVLILVFIIQDNIKHSQWGRDFLCLKSDAISAETLGINVPKTRTIGFLVSSLIIGFAGALFASYASFIAPESFGFNTSIMVLLMLVTGGSGTVFGPIVGAVIITFLPQLLNNYSDLKQLFYGAMLIIIVQLMPKGIVGLLKKKFKENDDYYPNNSGDNEANIIDKSSDKNVNEDLLVVENITKRFGGLTAVNNLSFTVKKGEIHALIGPNGAGKTTVINMLTGIDRKYEGKVLFFDKEITRANSHSIARCGIARTFQHVRLSNELTVLENVAVAARLTDDYPLFDAIFNTKKKKIIDKKNYEKAYNILTIVGLDRKINEFPDNLSSGQQKLLELCRAMACNPQLMVLDEPCAGLTETETEQFAELITKIKRTGVSMLLVEHHMSLIMNVSDYITVIDHGTKISEGIPEKIISDPIVKRSYLGEK